MSSRRRPRKTNWLITLVLVIVFLFLYYEYSPAKNSNQPGGNPPLPSLAIPTLLPNVTATVSAPPFGQQEKTANCVASGGLPDSQCTPGAIFSVTTADICQPGYARSVRNVPESEKQEVYAEYGILSHQSGQYEVDHLISLELGGSNDIANLWPEAASPTPGFHQKDQVENYLHDQVCAGNISLSDAQKEIATDWLKVYQEMNNR